ncbi:MAG: metallophosphoesterase [Kofleriaceae bacterium]
MRALILVAIAACSGSSTVRDPVVDDRLAKRFPLAELDDRKLCDYLLARKAQNYEVWRDPEPATRRKVIVSDLHLGPGTEDDRFEGIEDFYADAEWSQFLAREGAKGPTDIIIAGDFIEFWQIATALRALPRPDASAQPPTGPVLGADRAFGRTAISLVLRAHPEVFRAIGRFLDSGDHRVIVIAGNHDADLLWPDVQLAIARAVGPRDLSRLVFLDAVAYVHGGVYVAHGHELDAANRFETQHAPFGRDTNRTCRLQSNWGEVFVDLFYTETERQIPFIDNLYPEKAAVLWVVRDNADLARDLGAAVRAIDMLRAAQGRGLNRDALGHVLQGAFGVTGERGPEAPGVVVDHLVQRLATGDIAIERLVDIAMELVTNPAARTDLSKIEKLRGLLFGDSIENGVADLMDKHSLDIVVLGHTHSVGGFAKKLRGGFYANTGSWISVASVADLQAKGVTFDDLSIADRRMFPSKMTAIVIDYDEGEPLAPVVQNGR